MNYNDLIKPIELDKALDLYNDTENAVFIDVRSKEDYDEFHVDYAYSLPIAQISTITALVPDTEWGIFIIDDDGSIGPEAAEALTLIGYKDVVCTTYGNHFDDLKEFNAKNRKQEEDENIENAPHANPFKNMIDYDALFNDDTDHSYF